ncbi:NAD-P-binding protein [Thelephora terrestris]|uniref:NAD-P-binding protein n=1 Tax=Thelephora terrestris TaxID=56493 RepID=A0A9P6HKH5_9AGAM|nr:NAD-P-binding protein [Thelephora terrestris]
MVSYAVTGASRGLGLAFVQALHARRTLRNPKSIIFALVQDLDTCDELKKLGRSDIHIIPSDLDKPETLCSAAAEVAKMTGGSLDIFINNAALIPSERGGYTLTSYIGKNDLLIQDFNKFYKTNVVGAVAVTNAFLLLIEKGAQKKVVNISSAAGDLNFVDKTGYISAVPYGVSKAALNYVNKKYAVEFRGKGYTFLAVSPGLVDTRPPPRKPLFSRILLKQWAEALL